MDLKSLRNLQGLKTQAELAKKLGVNQGNISEWEAGKGYPSFQMIKKLLQMGATTEELFGVKRIEADKESSDEDIPKDIKNIRNIYVSLCGCGSEIIHVYYADGEYVIECGICHIMVRKADPVEANNVWQNAFRDSIRYKRAISSEIKKKAEISMGVKTF